MKIDRITISFYILLFLTFSFPGTVFALPAFPGAEGFGASAIGGRGGRVIEVTNLNDAGSGSLRAAIEASGPRIVVFRTGGTIKLNSNIKISNPYITIAGQTAPGGGITIRGATLTITTSEVIVRGIRVRTGDDPNGPDPGNRDALQIQNNKSPIDNIIIDHCSLSWAVDETLAVYYENVNDVTVSNSIMSEALYNSLHNEGAHSMGPMSGRGARNISFIGNLMAHNHARNPKVKGGSVAIVNNVVYNRGYKDIDIGDGGTYSENYTDIVSVVGNIFIKGNSFSGNNYPISLRTLASGSKIYVQDNDCSEYTSGSCLNKNDSIVASPPVWPDGLKARPVDTALDWVLNNAGCTIPKRDSVDVRVIENVRNGTGRIIDSQDEVGGWPVLDPGTPPKDSDHDGMPDSWETARGLNSNSQSDAGGDRDSDGYTNIEEYINGLFAGGANPPPEDGNPPPQSDTAATFTPAADTYVSSGSPNTNFGSAKVLEVDGDPTDITYLRFKVTGLSGTVLSAHLRFDCVNGSSSGGTLHHMSDNSWDENTATFNTRPAIDGPILDTCGAVSPGNMVELDVTPAIHGNGTYSFAILSNNGNGADYRSREDSTNWPTLDITTNGEQDNSVPVNPTALRVKN